MPGNGKADLPEGGLAFVADGELLNLQGRCPRGRKVKVGKMFMGCSLA